MNIRLRAALVVVPTAVIALGLAATTTAHASTPSASIVKKGAYAITASITNNTKDTWTMYGPQTFLEGDSAITHWQERPLETLAPDQSETVSEYSSDLGGTSMSVAYSLPNGEYAYFWVNVPMMGDNSTQQGVWGGFDPNYTDDPINPDTSYSATGSTSHGDHISAAVEVSHS